MAGTYSSSGVIGRAGRMPVVDPDLLRSSRADLDGRPLPLVGTARIYTCGITPYDVTHLGHAATFVWADLLATVLHAAGVQPTVCRNVTDVDDVLTAAASGRGRPYDEFALTQEFLFDRDMRALRVAEPGHVPHARSHVKHVVQLAGALLRTGHAYERDGHVFFRGEQTVRASGLDEAEAERLATEFGDRAEDDGRDTPFDVPVWRPSPEDHPAWPSPWGWGRPGWHAECAAMAWAVCGSSIDVLVGGQDLAFPHHAYQSAMVEAASGVTPFARRQLHVGAVRHGGAKMAKSTRNLVLVGDLLAEHSGAAIRLLLLNRAWQRPWEYDAAQLSAAEDLLDRLYAAAARPSDSAGGKDSVLGALLADLDVPGAVARALDERGATARAVLDLLKLTP
ncbi:MAG TPA: cysteine--tRNA ligase [Nocardioidaceae bacterium]|nr:cysteine--tRNA ligase [Nocardioidaceae bacterium]